MHVEVVAEIELEPDVIVVNCVLNISGGFVKSLESCFTVIPEKAGPSVFKNGLDAGVLLHDDFRPFDEFIIFKSLIRHFLVFFKREEGIDMRGRFENHMVAGCRRV